MKRKKIEALWNNTDEIREHYARINQKMQEDIHSRLYIQV